MKSIKILTTAALAGALVAGAVAGPASAATDTAVTAQPVIITSTPAVIVPAYTDTAVVGINTTALDDTDLKAIITFNGAAFDGGNVYQDAAGNASYDVLRQISYKVANYGDVPPGTYGVYFTSAQDVDTDYSEDYKTSTTTTYLPATSPTIAVTVTRLQSAVTGFKTKTRTANFNRTKDFASIGQPTAINAGTGGVVYAQYKTSKKGKWHTASGSTVTVLSSGRTAYKVPYNKFNSVNKSKKMKRGTYYFRVVIKPNVFVTGAKSKQVKLIVK